MMGKLLLSFLIIAAIFSILQYLSVFFYPRGIRFQFVSDERLVEKFTTDKKINALIEKLGKRAYTFLGVFSEKTLFRTELSLTLASKQNQSFAYLNKIGKRIYCSFHTPLAGGGLLFTTNAPFPKVSGGDCLIDVFPKTDLDKLADWHSERLQILIAKGCSPFAVYDQASRIEAARQFYANPATKWGLAAHSIKALLKTASLGAAPLVVIAIVYLLSTNPFEGIWNSIAGLSPTVTAILQQKTATPSVTPIHMPTATPSLTPKTLSDQMGFSDITIQEIEANYTDCEVVQQIETSLQTDVYTASIIECREMSHLLVYKHETSASETSHYLALKVSDVYVCFQCGGISAENWQDVDQDGLPDLIVGHGNNYYWATYVYRMTAGGKLENLLETCPLNRTNVSPSFLDINKDGIWELAVTDTRWDYDKTDIGRYIPHGTRVYSLQNCTYQDVSASFPEFYEHTINVLFNNYEYILSGGANRFLGIPTAFDGLLACDAVGRREECWPAFWELTDMEKHPLSPADPTHPDYDPALIELQAWVTEMRTLLQKQYKAGVPFSPDIP